MLDSQVLAKALHDVLSQQVDGYGKPTPVSTESMEYASGVVAALKAASVSNAPGTVVGVTSAGSPLTLGAATGGIIVISPGPMIAKVSRVFPPQAVPNTSKENTALIAYIGTATVTFAPGSITGNCTSTGVSPGPLANGAGTNGFLVGITGAGAMSAVISALGFTGPGMIRHYQTLINYILAHASVTYASGSVVGVCPATSGPLSAGAATGGTIS